MEDLDTYLSKVYKGPSEEKTNTKTNTSLEPTPKTSEPSPKPETPSGEKKTENGLNLLDSLALVAQGTPERKEEPAQTTPVQTPVATGISIEVPKVEEKKAETRTVPAPTVPEVTVTPEETKPQAPLPLPEHEKKGLEKVSEVAVLEEDVTTPPKLVITIYGEKGTGKTTTAMSFREKVAVFSFDDKSSIVKLNMYNNDPRIKVFVPIRYWDKTSKDKITESARKVWDMILQTLKWLEANWRPDWIVIDAVEEFEKLIEQVMRHDYGLGPYDGIANKNVWKYRKDLFYSFLGLAERVAKYGVIFTTYPDYSEHISQGEVISRKPVPKWADYLQLVTDIVLYTFVDDRTSEYKVKVVTSKLDKFLQSGKTYGVTGTNLWDVAGLNEKIKSFFSS